MATRLHKDVQRLLNTHGYSVTFSRVQSGGSYNATTGKVSGGSTLTWSGRGVFVNYREEDVDGSSITTDDRKLLLQAVGLEYEPEPNDFVYIGVPYSDYVTSDGDTYLTSDGDTYQVLASVIPDYEVALQDVRKIQSGNTVIAYSCKARG